MSSVSLPPAPPVPPTLPPGTQPPPPPGAGHSGHSHVGMVLKNIAIFGGIGAAAGIGASLLGLPIIGGFTAPIAGLVGGVAGALIGLVKGIFDVRRHERGSELPPPPPGGGGGVLPPTPPPGASRVS